MSAFRGTRTPGWGFTLVELLVVIAIIRALVAMLVGAIGPAIRMAQNLQCQNNLKQIATAVINYATDYRGAIPPTKYTGTGGFYWCNILVRGNYLSADDTSTLNANTPSQSSVLKCPAASDLIISDPQTSISDPKSALAQGTARLGNTAFMVDCSYYWNGYDGNTTGAPDTSVNAWTLRFPSVVVNPAATPNEKAQVIHDISEIRKPGASVTAMVMDGVLFNAKDAANRGRIAARHKDGVQDHSGDPDERYYDTHTNVVFYDGHVEGIDRNRSPNNNFVNDGIQSSTNLDTTLSPFFLLPKR